MLCRGAWSLLTHSQTNEPLGENEIWCKCGRCCISCTRRHPGSKAKMNTDAHRSPVTSPSTGLMRSACYGTVLSVPGSTELGDSGWAWTQMCWRASTRGRPHPLFSGNECLVRPWNAVIGPKSGLIWSQITSILLSLLPAPRTRTRPVWCRFKWPWLLFLQYCLSQCIRHLG